MGITTNIGAVEADGIGYGSPFFGVSLVHTSDTVVTVTPNTDPPFDGKGRVLMYDTSEVGKWFTISATIAIDNTTEGPTANGKRNGLTIGNNLPYPIYLYGKADGTVCGQYLGTGEDPTSYFPTDYTYVSPCMGAVCSDGTADWIPFYHRGNAFYFASKPTHVLNPGTSTATTPAVAVDLSAVVPEEAVGVFMKVIAINNNPAESLCLTFNSTATFEIVYQWWSWPIATAVRNDDSFWIPLVNTPATALYYYWSGAPSTGAYVGALGFEMEY